MKKQDEWKKEITQTTENVIHCFAGLSPEKLRAKPNPERWSIAENLHHLIQVNSSYFPIFEKLKSGTFENAFISKIGFFPKTLGNLIYKSVSDGGRKKTKTFPLWEPSLSETSPNILTDFQKHQTELISWINGLEPYVEVKTIIHSPVNRLIVYSLEKAFDIIVAHEKRHLEQAKNVLKEIQEIPRSI